MASLEEPELDEKYTRLKPILTLGLPFKPREIDSRYLDWPLLPQLIPVSFPGVKTSRDTFLVAMVRSELDERLDSYFSGEVDDGEMRRIAPEAMESTARFQASHTRQSLQRLGRETGHIVRYQYRPMDVRWLYWHPETKLLDEKRLDYFQQVHPGNVWLSAGQRNRMARFYQPQFTAALADHHIVESNVAMFPMVLHPAAQQELGGYSGPHANISTEAIEYLQAISAEPKHLFYHVLAALHAPRYSGENADALRQDWPRIPLPATKDALLASAKLGELIAALLNTEAEAKGITSSGVRPELKMISNITAAEGGTLDPTIDLLIEVGWGRMDNEGRISACQGSLIERDYTDAEREAIIRGAVATAWPPNRPSRNSATEPTMSI